MFHPRLVAYIRDLVGPDIVCWGTHYFCKLPHDNRQVAWHQDCYYWPLTPTRTVTAWLAIDDSDLENGRMQFVTGSHRIGAVPIVSVGKTRRIYSESPWTASRHWVESPTSSSGLAKSRFTQGTKWPIRKDSSSRPRRCSASRLGSLRLDALDAPDHMDRMQKKSGSR